MKKTITFFLLIIICCNNFVTAQAPNWLWAKSAGGIYFDESKGVSTDKNGNVFVTGYFQSPTITFGTTSLINSGGDNIFIVKYDAGGNVLWAKSAGGNINDRGYSVSSDASGNVFMTGYFSSDTITFGTTTLTNADSIGYNDDIFIAKYDVNGNVLWAKSAGGTDDDAGNSVSTDANGNVFMTGKFDSDTITFGINTLTNKSTSSTSDIFIAKYDAGGNVLWAKRAGGYNEDESNSLSTDTNGNVLMAGYFASTSITFGTTTLSHSGNGTDKDIFIVKYNANGNVLWAKSAGGNLNDIGYSVSNDVSGNVIITGSFQSNSLTFGTTTLTNASAGLSDIFIVKYNTNGNVLWAKNAGGTNTDFAYAVCTDASENIFLTGAFWSPTIVFGTTTLTNLGIKDDIFIVKYDASGNVFWAKSVGSNSYDEGTSIASDANGNVFLTGLFGGSPTNFGTITLSNAGNDDIFIAKLDTSSITGIEELIDHSTLIIAPNPFTSQTTLTFIEEQKNTAIKIMDVIGNEIRSTDFSGKQFVIEKGTMKPGIYFVQTIDQKKNVANKKMVIQ